MYRHHVHTYSLFIFVGNARSVGSRPTVYSGHLPDGQNCQIDHVYTIFAEIANKQIST